MYRGSSLAVDATVSLGAREQNYRNTLADKVKCRRMIGTPLGLRLAISRIGARNLILVECEARAVNAPWVRRHHISVSDSAATQVSELSLRENFEDLLFTNWRELSTMRVEDIGDVMKPKNPAAANGSAVSRAQSNDPPTPQQ